MRDRILVVDDDRDACELMQASLETQGFTASIATSGRAALDLTAREDFDVVLTDLAMSDMHGLELAERLIGARPDVPIVVVTGLSTLESSVSAMRVGAFDFLTKPVDAKVLGLAVARAAQRRRLAAEVKRLASPIATEPPSALVGESDAMKRVMQLVARVSATEASVLIHGETGTGKELIARAIHQASQRASGPFVAINCAAVPASLLESELFGHAKGAFTDARAERKGLFVQASGGTFFLDEIAEMPLEMQAKLLRALQERVVRPVGSSAEIAFDARIVAATNRELEGEVEARRFRNDLYYRINVVRVDLPPLRQRGNDVLELAAYFLRRYAHKSKKGALAITEPVAQKLAQYDWPGNVRELENCMERAAALARFEHVTIEDLPEKIRGYRSDKLATAEGASDVIRLEELERRYIQRVLKLLGGNKSRAAQVLGVDRRTLYRKLERYKD